MSEQRFKRGNRVRVLIVGTVYGPVRNSSGEVTGYRIDDAYGFRSIVQAEHVHPAEEAE